MIYKCMRRFVNECVTVTVINGTWNVRALVIHSTEEEMMGGIFTITYDERCMYHLNLSEQVCVCV